MSTGNDGSDGDSDFFTSLIEGVGGEDPDGVETVSVPGSESSAAAASLTEGGAAAAGGGEDLPPGDLVAAGFGDSEDVPEHWREKWGGRVAVDGESERFVFVSILTVPDPERCEFPALVPPEEVVNVDLSKLDAMSAGEVGALISATLSDAQLQVLCDAEMNRDKPRAVALGKIRAEMNRRGPADCGACGNEMESFAAWVERTSRDPATCRVVAIAVAIGAGDPKSFVVDRDCDEAGLLREFFAVSDDEIAGFDLMRLIEICSARGLALDLPDRRRRNGYPVPWRPRSVGRNCVVSVAKSFGLEIPEQATAAQVLQSFREHEFRRLESMVVDKLEASRAVILADRSVR